LLRSRHEIDFTGFAQQFPVNPHSAPISRSRGFSSAEVLSLVLALRLLAHFGRRTAKYNQHLQTKKKTTPQVSHAQS
jgi:hypothetical protein